MKIFPTIWRKRYKFFSSSCAIIDEFLEIERYFFPYFIQDDEIPDFDNISESDDDVENENNIRPFQERQKSTIMDSNENISDNMAEKVEQAEDINDEKNHKRLENKELNTNENSPFNIESFCSIQLTELEEDEKELKECGGSDMVGKLCFN